eukprot:6172239-Karenia_brevis.AAC.1
MPDQERRAEVVELQKKLASPEHQKEAAWALVLLGSAPTGGKLEHLLRTDTFHWLQAWFGESHALTVCDDFAKDPLPSMDSNKFMRASTKVIKHGKPAIEAVKNT